jgi:hypothetical protein
VIVVVRMVVMCVCSTARAKHERDVGHGAAERRCAATGHRLEATHHGTFIDTDGLDEKGRLVGTGSARIRDGGIEKFTNGCR